MKLYQELERRMNAATGTPTAGDCNYLADVLSIVSTFADGWTNRADDAIRIPDMIAEQARYFRQLAKTKEA